MKSKDSDSETGELGLMTMSLTEVLIFDVLGHILTFCDPWTVLAFGKTCHKYRRLLPQLQKRWNQARGLHLVQEFDPYTSQYTRWTNISHTGPPRFHGMLTMWDVSPEDRDLVNIWCLSQGMDPAWAEDLTMNPESTEAYYAVHHSMGSFKNSTRYLDDVEDGPVLRVVGSDRKSYTMRHGVRDGLYEKFDNGILVRQKTYRAAAYEGPSHRWYKSDGSLRCSANYVQDRLHGKVIYRDHHGYQRLEAIFENSHLLSYQTWHIHETALNSKKREPLRAPHHTMPRAPSPNCESVFDGQVYRSWYRSGNARDLCPYKNGLREGDWLKYQNNTGLLQSKIPFKDGLYHGPFTKYHFNGKIYQAGEYERGCIVGELRTFDKDGKLDSLETYKVVDVYATPPVAHQLEDPPFHIGLANFITMLEKIVPRVDQRMWARVISGQPEPLSFTSVLHGPYQVYKKGVLV